MSRIYTRTGDKGTTSLVGGKRVSKADIRLEAYGTVDELNSVIGLLRSHTTAEQDITATLHFVQNKLFNIGSILATEADKEHYVAALAIKEEDIQRLEQAIDILEADLPPFRGFILPAGSERVALCHLCRTVTRRTERRVTALIENDPRPILQQTLTFLNRLSDYFFNLSKKIAQIDESDTFFWEK